MVVVAGDVTRIATLDFPGCMSKDVPDRRSASAFGGCTLDLITGSGRSPKERFGRGIRHSRGLFQVQAIR